jgi:chemotaxis-related protein WspB
MLFLLFQLGNDRYAIEAARVIEILPFVNLKSLPHAPCGVAGVFDYRGEPVPVIDLAELTVGVRSRSWMSTRIMVVNYDAERGGSHVLGLLAEHATDTLRRNGEDFTDAGVFVADAPYLGPVVADSGSVVQRIEIDKLLSRSVRDLLFRERMDSV